MPKTSNDPLCPRLPEDTVLEDADRLEHAHIAPPALLETIRVLRAYVALRKEARKEARRRKGHKDIRNCDVMVTPTALRKGWARRCAYGTPCCPFEYALELFDPKEEKHG